MPSPDGAMLPATKSNRRQKSQRSTAAVVLIADAILIAATVFFTIQLGFAFQLHHPMFFKMFFAGIVVVTAAVRGFGKPTVRVNAALGLVPFLCGLVAFEAYAAWRHPRDATAAWLAGRPFDSRDLWECLKEERAKDPSVVSYVIPRALLTHRLVVEDWEPEAVTHAVPPDWGIVVDGVRTLPLGGISKRRTVFGNESGTRVIYESDEHGFNNPRGIWEAGDLQVAIVGDSFSHGAAVAPERIAAAHIRKRYPRTLTLGMSANGPLMEYAGLKEYLVDLKPRIVLWMYYLNDLSDLEVEKQSPLLLQYLEDDGFRQGLAAKQAKIDKGLESYLQDVERQAPRKWPASLESAGLTRRTTPLWVQDLVTSEQHSSLAAFLRLHALTWTVTKRFLEVNYLEQPPDYALFERILAKAGEVVASWGGKLYFVYLPAQPYLGSRHRVVFGRDEVLALVKRLGIPLIDVHQVFLDRSDGDRLRFHYESHANEAGYELHAKTILETLDAAAEPKRATGEAPPDPGS
jgi:hypothetical protein